VTVINTDTFGGALTLSSLAFGATRGRAGVSVAVVLSGGVTRPARLLAAGAVIVAGTALALGCGGCGSGRVTASRSLVTPTTQIAGAGVLGNNRHPDEACAREAASADPGPATRQAHNAPGVSPDVERVPAEAQRIVVLSGGQLDALCALGLQSRVVAAALADGAAGQPSYLGAGVHGVPSAGTWTHPDVGRIAAAHPDLILGSQAMTPALYPQLAAIAPTVFTAAPGAAWEDNLRAVGAATARGGAVDGLIGAFEQRASQIGATHDAAHVQASVVQLTTSTIRVYGANNFPATVLTAAGVDRPAAQRFTDKPYIEIGATDADLAKKPHLSLADADVVYVSCASSAAAERAATVLDSDSWRALSANRDNRVYVVNDEVWHTGRGLVAARGILDDLGLLNAPIN
jgi:iron complex transport system substrate-binding protein